LLSVFVADQPARPVTTTRNEQTLHLLALPKTSDADLSFTVEAVIAGRLQGGDLPRSVRITRSDVQLPVPDIVSPQDDPEYGIPVVRTKWTVCFPSEQDLEIVEADTNLSQLESGAERLLDLDAALSDASSLLSVLKETGSARAKYEALGNLKKLEGEYLSGSDASLEGQGKLGAEVAQRRSQVLSEIRKNEAQIRVDEANQTAVSKNGVLASQDFDVAFQLKQAQEFNTLNRGDVDGDGVARSEKLDEKGRDLFRFSREGEELSIEKDSADKGQSSDSKLSAKQNLSQRREKGSQQLQLNEELERQKVQTNAPQPAKPADAPAETPAAEPGFIAGRQPRSSGRGDKGVVGAARGRRRMAEPSGGGSGGGQSAPFAALEETGGEAGIAGKPLAAGGLSLRVGLEPPAGSQKLIFSKPGGSPRLSVAVRPKESLQTGLGSLWALVWLVLGAGLVAAFGGAKARPEVRRHLPKVVAAVGLVSFLILPMPLNGFGLTIFVIGLAIALRRQKVGA
jgi:hypothetical protein